MIWNASMAAGAGAIHGSEGVDGTAAVRFGREKRRGSFVTGRAHHIHGVHLLSTGSSSRESRARSAIAYRSTCTQRRRHELRSAAAKRQEAFTAGCRP